MLNLSYRPFVLRGVLLTFLLGYFFIYSADLTFAQIETVQVYSHPSDGVASLSDLDAISGWEAARSYSGEISLEPATLLPEIPMRSDRGVGTYRIYRGSIPFDTSVVPENASIQEVRLVVSQGETANDGDEIVVTSHTRENPVVYAKADWQIDNFGTQTFSRGIVKTDGTQTVFSLTEDVINYINRDGYTVLGLLTEYDFDDVDPGTSRRAIPIASSEATGTSTDPYLEITYTVEDGPVEREGLYTQIKSPYPSLAETASWASDAYAAGKNYACGSTIAACGCAITSLVMMAVAHGVEAGVDGTVVNPKNFDDWLTANNGYTGNGSIKWAKGLEYFGTRNEDGKIETPFSLEKHNEKNMSAIQTAASADDTDVMAFSTRVAGGHYLLLDDYVDGSYAVRDPWYYDTLTLNDTKESGDTYVFDYDNQVTKANLFSVDTPSTITNFLDITLESPAELVLRDSVGRIAGWEDGEVVTDVPNSSYDREEFIGNPAWEESPTDPHYVKRLIITQTTGEYELEVVGTGTGMYTLSIDLYDQDGNNVTTEFTASTTPGQVDRLILNTADAAVEHVDDPVDPQELDRAVFIAIVEATVASEASRTQRYLLAMAHRVFDRYENEKFKQAQVMLRVFAKMIDRLDVQDDALTEAIIALNSQLVAEM